MTLDHRALTALNAVRSMYGNDAQTRIVTEHSMKVRPRRPYRWEVFDKQTGEWFSEYDGSLMEVGMIEAEYRAENPDHNLF